MHFGHCANMSLHPTKILLYLSVIKNIREWCFVMCRHLSPHQSWDSSFPNPLIYFFILCTYPITCALTESHMLLQIIYGTKRLHWFRIFQFVRAIRNHILVFCANTRWLPQNLYLILEKAHAAFMQTFSMGLEFFNWKKGVKFNIRGYLSPTL